MLTINKNLISKYAVSVPRYTSYPTAVEFNPSFGEKEWKETIEKTLSERSTPGLSLYTHIPFCPKLCYFCACNKIITTDRSVTVNYLKAVFTELQNLSNYFGSLPVYQIHWGGGSPNFLVPNEMKSLQEETIRLFPDLQADAEVSVELDPRTTTLEQLKALREVGFNRVSFGVQDFDLNVQETINRVQSFDETKYLSDQSRKLGFKGINLDLIYGLPNQTLKGFSNTLSLIKEIRPDRIALYGYAHVTWLQKVQKSFERAHLPTPEERIELFQLATKELVAAGYVHIGLDHFALPADELSIALDNGSLHRNFMGYTTHKGATLLGFGASAISTLKYGFSQNEKDPQAYQKLLESNEFPIIKGLKRTDEDLWRGEIIEQVLCNGLVGFDKIASEYRDFQPIRDLHSRLEPFIQDGIVELTESGLKLTELGRFFSRNVAALFDAYLDKHTSKKTFSQAV